MNPSHISSGVEALEEENRRLRRAVEELSILNQIATAINSTRTVDEIVSLMVRKCIIHLQVEQASVMLLDKQNKEHPLHTMVRRSDRTSDILPLRLDAELTGWVIRHQKPLAVNDLHHDERFQGSVNRDLPIHSLLSVPMITKGKMVGVVTVFNKKSPGGFTEEDQRLLAIISSQSAQVIENARLLEEEQRLLRMQEEMRLATEIQKRLLPPGAPDIPGYDIAGVSIPAKEVGGDYFDFIPLPQSQTCLAFCLGDVSGKGMPAALLMANLQAAVRTQAFTGPECDLCMENVSTLLYHNTGEDKFATVFYGTLNHHTHTLTYCNAGHDDPFLFTPGEGVRSLSTGGIVVGFMPRYDYRQETVSIAPGARLILYSDGITEAQNAADEEFGVHRLQRLIESHPRADSAEFVNLVIKAVQQFAGDTPQADDMTLVVIGRRF